MEKLSQIMNKFLKFLPRQPVASMIVQNPTLSPSSSRSVPGSRTPPHKVSIIPKEARRKLKSSSFSAREPTSPKVSCMGEVKCKKRKGWKHKGVQPPKTVSGNEKVKKQKMLLWIFKGSGGCESPKQGGKTLVLEFEEEAAATDQSSVPLPSLGTMKKFASGRGTLSDFNVKVAEQ